MKVACVALAVAACLAAAPCSADEPLAGGTLATASHGQAFCTDRAQLQALLSATIAHYPFGTFSSCLSVPDNARVEVIEDLSPGSRTMHVVRARAYLLFGAVDAYTYSVGLYPPIRGYAFPPPVATYR